jgi:NADPH:quinone reductase-like Zn-dependent oxidoreductase
MKAIIYQNYGAPEVLNVAEVKKPEVKEGQILIKVLAAEVTKADCEMRSFKFPVKWFWLPLRIALGITKPRNQILGGYFCGVVDEIGDIADDKAAHEAEQLQVGQTVFGSAGFHMGAYGEYLCLSSDASVISKPTNMSPVEAAALPLGGFNALHYLKRANIQPGEKVLINGAGGSIGLFAVQIAKQLGAEITAVDSGAKQQMLESIGIDHFIDYTKTDFTKSSESYDVIFSMVASNSYSGCIRRLKSGGRYLMANPRFLLMLRSVLTTRFSNKTVLFAFAGEKKEELLELKDMVEKEQIRSIIDKVYQPEQAAEAHHRVETENRIGSVVIRLQ